MVARQFAAAILLIAGAASAFAANTSTVSRAAAVSQNTRVVRLTTADDVGVIATYYPVERDHAPGVVLLHDLNKDRSEWNDFASLLQRNGLAAFAIDFRGHGESTRKLTAAGPVELKIKDFTGRDLQDMLLDVEAAVDWLQTQPEIDKTRIVIIGAGLGANLALRYAAINEDLAGVAALSPAVNNHGIRTDDVIRQTGSMPVHIFVSTGDTFAFESSKRLIEIRKESGVGVPNRELTTCTGDLYGVSMFKGVKDLSQVVLTWCQQAVSGALRAEPSPALASPSPPTRGPTSPPKK